MKKHVAKIRDDNKEDLKSKEMKARQRAVALYFIDRLALRAGNEKDDDSADTVGCCSLRVEHINLYPEQDGKEYVVEFDFLGKDSIRYQNSVPVEKRVFKNLQLFMENKQGCDDLFDRLNVSVGFSCYDVALGASHGHKRGHVFDKYMRKMCTKELDLAKVSPGIFNNRKVESS